MSNIDLNQGLINQNNVFPLIRLQVFKAVLSFKGNSLKQKMCLIKALWSLLPFTATVRGPTQRQTQSCILAHACVHLLLRTLESHVYVSSPAQHTFPAIRWLRLLWGSFASCSYLTEMEWLENGERFISPDILNSDLLLKAMTSGCRFFHSIPSHWGPLIARVPYIFLFQPDLMPDMWGVFRPTTCEIVLGIGGKNNIRGVCVIQN